MQKVLNHLFPFSASVVSAILVGTLVVMISLASKHGLNLFDSVNMLVVLAAIAYSGLIGLVSGLACDLVRLWIFSSSGSRWTYIAGTVIAFVLSMVCLISMGNLQAEHSISPIALVVLVSTISWSVAHYRVFASANRR